MATIYIDNVPYEVGENLNLLDACLSLGFDIPYFCWHPAMGSVGACRQCAVKVFRDEHDTKGRVVMSCMTPATDGTRLSIDDEDVRQFRRGIIELLMVNHPHDCPVCDEGGECHLQDMTLLLGQIYRRYRFSKRTYRNQCLGPLVNHEMNRCIQCYRCVRFYRDVAGGRDFNVFGAHDNVYFGRQEEGVLESEFSGNLVEVCPTGVFTDKTLKRHYTRPWDLMTAPSVCVHCGVGCNTFPGERYKELRRIRNRYNGQVNGYFLCDRGRYGYEFVNHPKRIRGSRIRRNEELEPLSPDAAVARLRALTSGGRAIGIGSPRASLESNFALRALVGAERFYAGMSAQDYALTGLALDMLRQGPARSASLRDLESIDAALILGEDLTNSAPMMALALRQWLRRRPTHEQERLGIPLWNAAALGEIKSERGVLYVASPYGTKLDGEALEAFRGSPEEVARLGMAVAELVAGRDGTHAARVDGELAARMAAGLKGAKRPAIISGTLQGSAEVLKAAANVAWALREAGADAQLALAAAECNSVGARLLGGGTLEDAMAAVESGKVDTVVILENDLYRRAPRGWVDALLGRVRHVVVLDHIESETSARAELVLPAGTFAESDGTYVNYEGRAQRFYQVFVPVGDIRESWRWLRQAAEERDGLDAVVEAMTESAPELAGVRDVAPGADYRVAGMRVARAPHRYSGRTAMHAHYTVHEPKPPEDVDSPLSFSMEGYQGEVAPAVAPSYWAPGWNSPQAVTKFQQEVGGELRGGDPGVRLIEPKAGGKWVYYLAAESKASKKKGTLTGTPMAHIFGTDELSVLSAGVAQLVPGAYVALHPDDAAALGLAEGAAASVTVEGVAFQAPVRLRADMARGVAGVPAGLPEFPYAALPGPVTVAKGEAAQ